MRPVKTTPADFGGQTLNLNMFQIDGQSVFVDLDTATAGALTGDTPAGQLGVMRIGETSITLLDVENIIGTDANERLFGGEEDGFILAGAGDDTVHPFNGDDFVDGGAGTDTLLLNAINGALRVNLKAGFATTEGQTNTIVNFENVTGSNLFSDLIIGDRGDNVLSGGAGGDDTLRGGRGDDTLEGGDGADRLLGGAGRDELMGGKGEDFLHGGRGRDELTGGEGADKFIFTGRSGADTIVDLNFIEGDAVRINNRWIGDEMELAALANRLNTDRFNGTSAEMEGDDLVLNVWRKEITIEGGADFVEPVMLFV